MYSARVVPVLSSFGLSEKDLLGQGGESWVYALDHDRVLRIAKHGTAARSYVEARKRFYETIPKFSFATPRIFSIDEVAGELVSIENRIEGRPLSAVLHSLSAEEKHEAFTQYHAVIQTLSTVEYSTEPYGELLTKRPIRTATWKEYLVAQAAKAVDTYELDKEVPDFSKVTSYLLNKISQLPEPTHSLVHGDYAPTNVMVSDVGSVTGVIDFSGMSVVGDPLLDVAGSYVFLEVMDGYESEDSDVYKSLLTAHYGETLSNFLDTYRLYYSYYFGFARDDVRLHEWCVRNLRECASRLGSDL